MARSPRRWRQLLSIALVTLLASVGLATAGLAAIGVGPSELISALESAFGVTPGQRRNHTKGVCATGSFVAEARGATYSRSPLFSGQPIPVVARFSVAGGRPKAPDTARNPRGLGVQFQLPKGQVVNFAAINTPVFGAASTQTFVDNLVATKPDPATGKPDPEAVKAFRARHPDARAQAQFLAANNPPFSYASTAYYGLHAFRFVNRAGRESLVRWQFDPADGDQRLSDEELQAAPAHFLEQRLIERTQKGPVVFDLLLTIGQKGDVDNDPTVAWPAERRRVKVGTLTLDAASPQKGAACERISYDPLVLGDGIVASDDPILRARSGTYALSFARRISGS